MKKFISVLLICLLVMGAVPAMAKKEPKANNYSMPKDGTVLQNVADREIKPKTDLSRNPVIPGESPTTGLPVADDGLYMPMLVQISNPAGTAKVNGKKVTFAGIGERAPWGGQYADLVYEGNLYRSGETRITFLFSDSFADGMPTSAGPVRSARIGHVLLREEWQGGIVFAGGPRREENNIAAMFSDLGASDKGVVFNLLDNNYQDYKSRVEGVKSPDNVNINLAGLRSMVPSTTVAQPRPFLFADSSPYVDGYEFAYSINLDWGHKKYISHFFYDEANNLYLRYSGDAPYMTFAAADDRSLDNQSQMSFSNVIVQRVPYEYVNNNKIMPVMQSVGKGNADIFIGGRYIPGYWVRKTTEDPTIYFDDQGNELQLTRGKTFIVDFPPENLLTYQGVQ
ncbi:MAG: DUF3048 C-terminal domain-containing protein [Clostridia bacterium]